MSKGKYYVDELRRECRGWFMMEPCYDWVAYCGYRQVAQARTKADCIRIARERGYCVRRGM